MLQFVKIESKDQKEVLTFASADLILLKIEFDSPDASEVKFDKISNIVEIYGKLGDDSQKSSASLAKWALMNSTDPLAYRKMTVWIIGEENKIFRKMEYPYAFLVDYVESFGNESSNQGDDNLKPMTFKLKVKQKIDRLKEIIISSEPLTFNPEKNGFTIPVPGEN
jgi:hypothetical protein